jgi:hypothetical protein
MRLVALFSNYSLLCLALLMTKEHGFPKPSNELEFATICFIYISAISSIFFIFSLKKYDDVTALKDKNDPWTSQDYDKKPQHTLDLHFKTPEAALQYAGRFMDCDIAQDRVLPCIVRSIEKTPTNGLVGIVELPTPQGSIRYIAAFPNVNPYDFLIGELCSAYIGPSPP